MSEVNKPGQGFTCFVIGPIGSKLAPFGTPGRTQWESSQHLWENLFEPACERLGLTPLRADKIAEQGEITEQIFLLLRDADIVIADLSGGNPNVMYELGLRHTRDKITIQVGEYERLPFDVNTIRTIQFRRTDAGLVDAREALVEALTAALSGRGSPVAATRLWNEANPASAEALADAVSRTAQADVDSGDESDEGFMDVLAEGEAAMEQIADTLDSATAAMTDIGHFMEEAAAQGRQSDANRGGFAGRLRVAQQLAADLKEPSDAMGSAIADFLGNVEKSDLALTYIFDQMAADPEELAQGRELLGVVIEMAKSSEATLEGVASMMEGARDLKKVARVLVEPMKTIQRSLGQYSQAVDVISGWKTRAEGLLAEG